MPVNYDHAVSRAAVFDRARNRDFEFDTTSPSTLQLAIEDTV